MGIHGCYAGKDAIFVKNVKYTLYAKHGSAFRAGLHVLYIGDWIIPDLGKYVVLVHGTMSRNEYNVLCTKSEIPIYEYAPVSWTNIFPYLENGFFRIRRIGSLYKTSDPDVWKGGLKNTMAGINQDWLPGYDRPCLNQWYQCKCRDDWYKIVKEGRVT